MSRDTRSINDVLVEPGANVAPTKRRRGKAKRAKEIKPQGTIQTYFAHISKHKVWSKTPENDDGGGGGARKRKGDFLMDGASQRTQSEKSRRRMVEETPNLDPETNSGTECSFNFGAKSGIGEETTARHEMGENGLELNSLAKKEGGMLPWDWTDETDENI